MLKHGYQTQELFSWRTSLAIGIGRGAVECGSECSATQVARSSDDGAGDKGVGQKGGGEDDNKISGTATNLSNASG